MRNAQVPIEPIVLHDNSLGTCRTTTRVRWGLAMAYCHKHGQGLATGRCDKCDDELIALGIQADKDKIKELEAKAKTLEERVCTCAAKDMPFGRCCKSD